MDVKIKAILVSFIMLIAASVFISAAPIGPDSINITSNETASDSSTGVMVNISGGYLATIDINATAKNTRWKAFLGNINGRFTLDDASGSTIYDWASSSISGEVFATRDSATIEWSNITCANATEILAEDTTMSHIGEDNISSTFSKTNDNTYVIANSPQIDPTNCSSINPYQNNQTQDSSFEEIILHDETSIIYATTIEDDVAGYDGVTYDFQMLVPENGSASFTGATAYYLYVELN